MTRLNITIPDEIALDLKAIKNKSRFIAEALRARFEEAKRKRLEAALIEGYKKSAKEDKGLNADWESATSKGGWDG